MSALPPAVTGLLFLVSAAVTLLAARTFARRLDRQATRVGMPEALVGVLTALAADSPEISSALVALANGAHGVSVGVVVGSNVFNLAAMIGLSALLVGTVRLPRPALMLEGGIAVVALLAGAAVLLGWLPPVAAACVVLAFLVPYLSLLIGGRELLRRLPFPAGLSRRLGQALEERERAGGRARPSREPAWHDPLLFVADTVLIVLGSIGMVQAALALGHRWHVGGPVIGVLVLAPLTSVPNAVTGVRLGLSGRGPALVSETFNSNTINLVAGIVLPALFVSAFGLSTAGRLDLLWLGGMTGLVLLLLSRSGGMGRVGAIALVVAYVAFVSLQLVVR